MSIQGQIDRLNGAKTAVAGVLASMGAAPPEGNTLDQHAALLTARVADVAAALDTINGEVI